MTKQVIREEMEIHKEWYKEAEKMSMDKLFPFINHLLNDYEHDYGTICHALAAGAIATANAMNNSEQGGITGFQAGAVMWKFIEHWLPCNGPMRLVRYEEMLYPQYAEKFEKTISEATWKWLQKEAKKLLESGGNMHPDVKTHMESIVNGKVPFGYTIKAD